MIPTEIWILPRPRRNKYKGGFPLHFEQKLWRLLDKPAKVLHPFGGAAEIGDRVDINPNTKPTWVGDAHDLKFIPNCTYDLVILDPPYSDEQATKLYCTPKLRYTKYVDEAIRVTKVAGHIAIYHWVLTPRPKQCQFTNRILILTRVWHRPRVCCVFKKDAI